MLDKTAPAPLVHTINARCKYPADAAQYETSIALKPGDPKMNNLLQPKKYKRLMTDEESKATVE